MFHGFERFVHRPVDKLACPGVASSMAVNGGLSCAGSLGSGGAADVRDRECQGVELALRESELIYACSPPFGIRPLRVFGVIGAVLVSLLVLARRVFR